MNGHIRQRSPGSWELRYSLGTDASGKRKVVTTTYRGSRKDAEKEMRRRIRLVDTNEHAEAGSARLTVGAWLESWLASSCETLAPQTQDRYGTIVRGHLIPALGAVPLVKLTPARINEFYTSLGERQLSPRGRRLIHQVLTTALSRAVELQLIVRNPTEGLRRRLPKVPQTEMLVLTPEQCRCVIEATKGTQLYAPVLIALATGARRGECLALRWKNVDLTAGTALISESLEQRRGSVRAKAPKGEKSRTVALPIFAVDALRQWKRQQAEDLLRLGVRQNGDTRVCVRLDGKTPTPIATSHAFTDLMRKLPEMPAIHFHSLRHTHATQLLAAGVHPKVAQERLGHSKITLTMDLYSHVTPGMQREAADKLDKLLG
jgi:integrase